MGFQLNKKVIKVIIYVNFLLLTTIFAFTDFQKLIEIIKVVYITEEFSLEESSIQCQMFTSYHMQH